MRNMLAVIFKHLTEKPSIPAVIQDRKHTFLKDTETTHSKPLHANITLLMANMV